MSKVKTKKHDTFIDMTAMSDVTVLLLTFFMLTATFIPKEPIQVVTPQSVSEIKVPDYDVLTILIDPQGKVFMNIDRQDIKKKTLMKMGELYGYKFNEEDKNDKKLISAFSYPTTFIGVPMKEMKNFLSKPMDEQDAMIKNSGIPTDSTNNQLAQWVRTAKEVYNNDLDDKVSLGIFTLEDAEKRNLEIAIKADKETAYPFVRSVISTLQDLKENRYRLITNLKGMPEGF
jgi:biopolymer transport protein ExbD